MWDTTRKRRARSVLIGGSMKSRMAIIGAVVLVGVIIAGTIGQKARAAQAAPAGQTAVAGQGAGGGRGPAPTPPPTPPCGPSLPSSIKNVAKDSRCFELRTYTVREGSSIDLLHARFRDHTNALFRKHAMTVVGFWQPVTSPDTLIYILAYKDGAARDAAWAAFRAHP